MGLRDAGAKSKQGAEKEEREEEREEEVEENGRGQLKRIYGWKRSRNISMVLLSRTYMDQFPPSIF